MSTLNADKCAVCFQLISKRRLLVRARVRKKPTAQSRANDNTCTRALIRKPEPVQPSAHVAVPAEVVCLRSSIVPVSVLVLVFVCTQARLSVVVVYIQSTGKFACTRAPARVRAQERS